MRRRGLTVLRFSAQTVAEETDGVIDAVWRAVQARLRGDPLLSSPLLGEEADSRPPRRNVE